MSSCHLSGLPDHLHAGSFPATRRSTSTRRSCRTSSASGAQRVADDGGSACPRPTSISSCVIAEARSGPSGLTGLSDGTLGSRTATREDGAEDCYRAATILRRTTTNQADRRPFGFSIQQRLRFAWAVRVILGLDEALRRLTAGRRPELPEKADGRRATVRSTPGHGRESSAVTRGRALWRS
jgi:hypothetical protein